MKILILVTSCLKDPYPKLLKAQQKTWDSIYHENCETIFYHGNKNNVSRSNSMLYLDCSDGYFDMHWKFKKTLDFVWDLKWDYILKTNASTYVDKKSVYEYLETKKLTYAGSKYPGMYHSEKTYGHVKPEFDIDYITGTNIVLDRKSSEILKNKIKEHPYEKPIEDIVIGQILHNAGIEPEDGIPVTRWEWDKNEPADPNGILFRCKSNNNNRNRDIEVFEKIHTLRN